MTDFELTEWLHEKLAQAEKSLVARSQMESLWKSCDDKTWKALGCKLTKAQRLKEAAMQGRIAKKCQRDVMMFIAVITRIQGGQ